MNKLFKKYKRLFSNTTLKPLIVVFVLLATSALVYAASYTSYTFFKSSTGTTITVAEHSVGKNVTNSSSSGKNYFIPTKTVAEWVSFVSATPSLSGISLSGLSWATSDFGSCTVSCGGGTQTRTVWCAGSDGTIVPDNTYCTGNKPATSQSCNTQACPVNCVGSWSDTNICSLTCGGGVKQQTYTITTQAANGGTACPFVNGATRWGTTSCNTQSCVTYSWQPTGTYGTCSNGSYTCGPGTKSVNYSCKGSDTGWYPDSYCSGAGTKPTASVSCTIGKVCSGSATYTYDTLASTGGVTSFTVPNGITQVTVTVVGGGGGGGGGDGSAYGGGAGGGGAGGYISQVYAGLTTGAIIPVKVGFGGAGGFGGGNNMAGLDGGVGGSSGFGSFAAYGGGGGGGTINGSIATVGAGGAAGGVSGASAAKFSFAGSSGAVTTGTPYIDPDSGITYYSQPYTFGAGGAGGRHWPFGSFGAAGAPGGTWTNGGYCYSADNGSSSGNFGTGGGGANSAYYGNGTNGSYYFGSTGISYCSGGKGGQGLVYVTW
ncbi:MAG: thrombospondin type-1 domain-containing protein [Patescibacteria group bacterium]